MEDKKPLPPEVLQALLQAKEKDPTLGKGNNHWVMPDHIAAVMFRKGH
jgi:hypothetical protein